MYRHIFLSLLLPLCALTATASVGDAAYMQRVRHDFARKQQLMTQGDRFSIFRQRLTTGERDALTFLYAYMPVADIADYTGEFYLENVRLSEQARAKMPWGQKVTDDLYRHYVLPVRVNNESLDHSRSAFYKELSERVSGMGMYEAILEVNHWCHERVVYTPNDARTYSPLASIYAACGRCGEESTFTVAALRAIGIPARQVYTPRWAHTDDNHAWVEAWADGKWYFFGACEPEPVLNLGWFNMAASRGMLIHTEAFGHYAGEEEVMRETPMATRINLTDIYTRTAKATIEVRDRDGRTVEGARVDFKVYNYSELYTVASRQTGKEGTATLSAGRGDMLVWASKGGDFGYAVAHFAQGGKTVVTLDRRAGEAYATEVNLVPPTGQPNIPEVSAAQRAENDRRFAREDSLRGAYTATFMSKERAAAYVEEHQLPAEAADLLANARGNWQRLADFLVKSQKQGRTADAVALLASLSRKDLSDVTTDVLDDNLTYSLRGTTAEEEYRSHVLCPRVELEMLLPYKQYFQTHIAKTLRAEWTKRPAALADWCRKNITMLDSLCQSNVVISPIGVWQARTADKRALRVFFVSVMRSLGVPAWVDEVTGRIQYIADSGRGEVDFAQKVAAEKAAPTGRLMIAYTPTEAVKDPSYYTHFTLAKIDNGVPHTLSYDEGDVDMGGGMSWSSRFRDGVTLDEGYYMLTSGTRQSDGSVPAQLAFFNVKAGETTTVQLNLTGKAAREVKVLGHLDTAAQVLPVGGGKAATVADRVRDAKKYYVLAILGPGQEPTNHALRDIATLGKDFETMGTQMLFLFTSQEQSAKYRAADFRGLPATVSYGIDAEGRLLRSLAKELSLPSLAPLPLVVIADGEGRVVYQMQGYTIGLGEQLKGELINLK